MALELQQHLARALYLLQTELLSKKARPNRSQGERTDRTKYEMLVISMSYAKGPHRYMGAPDLSAFPWT